MSKILHITVADKIATYQKRDGEIVCGNSDYQIQFTFDAEWNAHATKTARFIWGGKLLDVVFTGTVCNVPVIMDADEVKVGVYAGELSATTPASIGCKKSIRCGGEGAQGGTALMPDVPAVLQAKEITANGTHTPDTGYEGFSQVIVNVPDSPATLQEKTAHPSTSEQTIAPDKDFDGLSKVTVGPMKLQSKTAEQNGEIIADSGYHGLDKVTVKVAPALQDKRLTITANGETEVIADSGYYGLDKVRVDVDVVPKLQKKTVAVTENGETIITADSGYDGMSEILVQVEVETGEDNSALPIEVATEAEMTALLESGEIGGVYKYTGTTGTYENGALYVLENATMTFTIAGTTYQAEDGMTWGEWVESNYNSSSFFVRYGHVYYGGTNKQVRNSDSIAVETTDIIKGGNNYIIVEMGSND